QLPRMLGADWRSVKVAGGTSPSLTVVYDVVAARAGREDVSRLREEEAMSGVRVLVGTRKGAFVLTSDGKRGGWEIAGPHFGGWEMYHLKASPADPNRLYAAQSTGWFGQLIQRSNDGGKTWEPGPAGCVCTRPCRIRSTPIGCSRPFRPPELSGPMMRAKPGGP